MDIILTIIYIFSCWTVHDITYYMIYEPYNKPMIYYSASASLLHMFLFVVALGIGIYLIITNTFTFLFIFLITAILSHLFARRLPRALLGFILDSDFKTFKMTITESYKNDINQQIQEYRQLTKNHIANLGCTKECKRCGKEFTLVKESSKHEICMECYFGSKAEKEDPNSIDKEGTISILLSNSFSKEYYELFKGYGFNVIWNNNMDELLKILQENEFDIFLDYEHNSDNNPLLEAVLKYQPNVFVLLTPYWHYLISEYDYRVKQYYLDDFKRKIFNHFDERKREILRRMPVWNSEK